MDYEIYAPTVTAQTVVNPYADPSGLTYVSNSSLAYYGGKFWAIMDGTTQGFLEGSTGQQIYVTTSTDGVTWTPAVQPFRDSAYCNNPITGSTTLEWSPSLVVVGNEMWCTWTGPSENGFVSKLTSPTGKWTNYRFEFSGTNVFMSTTITGGATGGHSLRATTDGLTDWAPFFTGNPIVLSSGVVVCPLAFTSSTLTVQTPAVDGFLRKRKFNALLKSSDGNNWSMTVIDTSAFGDFGAWEPFVAENPVGHVSVFSRNLNTLAADPDFLLVAHSTDGGVTFSSSVSTKMLVPTTRGSARQITPRRWLLTHADHPAGSNQTPDQNLVANLRRNGALFMSRRGGDDFTPGVNFSGDDSSMHYPQFITRPDGIWINYTSGGINVRRSLRIVKVSPLPDDGTAYVHPRSVNSHTGTTATDPTLHTETPPFYSFNGLNKAVSATSVTATTGVTYAMWLNRKFEGDVLMDTRPGGGTGQVFFLRGLAISSLNFPHGFTVPTDTPTFLAAVIDNTADTVTLYMANGGGFSTKTGYYKSILFAGQPSDGDTLAVNGVSYTYHSSPSLATDIAIGASTAATVTNTSAKLTTNSVANFSPGSNRLIMARTDIGSFSVTGSAQIGVETGIPLGGSPLSVGKAVSGSLAAFAGQIYEARLYDSPLSLANLTYLHNAKAASFGYANIGGTSTAPASPLVFLDPANPNPTVFPPLGTPARCEVVSSSTLRIHGEGSAGVELPYGATQLAIRYKLGAAPSGGDKYVIATFGTVEHPVRLYVDTAHPTSLYANGRLVAAVADPTVFNTVTVIVSTNKIKVGSFEQYFSGKPRCFLGSAYPESLLAVSKTVDYDVSAMTALRPNA